MSAKQVKTKSMMIYKKNVKSYPGGVKKKSKVYFSSIIQEKYEQITTRLPIIWTAKTSKLSVDVQTDNNSAILLG